MVAETLYLLLKWIWVTGNDYTDGGSKETLVIDTNYIPDNYVDNS